MGGRRKITDVVVWVGAVVIVAAAVAPIVLAWLTNQPDQRMVDLDVYRSGGQAVLRGAPLYEFLTQPPQLLPFTYPPFAALLAVPLAVVSWPVAQWVWVGLIYAALAIVVGFSFRDLLARTGRWAPLVGAVLVALAAYPMPLRDQVRFGQVDIILVAMCIADCTVRSPRWPRGLLIGLATAIKLVPGVFLIYLWVTGRRTAAITATVAAAAVTLGSFLVLPADSVDFWFGALLDSERLGSNTATANQSVRGMLMRLYWPESVTTVIWLGCVAVLAVVGFRAARRAALGGHEIVGVALTGLLAVLLSPVGWIHHLAWVVVALGALVGAGRDWRRWAVAAVAWLLYVLPVPWWGVTLVKLSKTDGFPGVIARLVQSSYGLGAVVLLLVISRWLLRRVDKSEVSGDDSVDGARVTAPVATL